MAEDTDVETGRLCKDGKDNDGDLEVDCDDFDCIDEKHCDGGGGLSTPVMSL